MRSRRGSAAVIAAMLCFGTLAGTALGAAKAGSRLHGAPSSEAALLAAISGGIGNLEERIDREVFAQSVASGDPRSESVVLWTRVNDPDRAEDDLPVELFVARDRGENRFEIVRRRALTARAEYDHVVKVRVDGLVPGTRYLYAFAYVLDGEIRLSPIGRTRTAPAPDQDVPVRFTVISCQDYIGRYYNTHLEMLRAYGSEPDVLVSVGDYVYETTGDPEFQNPSPDRRIVFGDIVNAIPLGDPAEPYYAASSLDNYRDLYRTYRTDPVLQQIHESFPIVAVWDDHEYSDDSHGATSTYSAGRQNEEDSARKRRAERVFFEYMPNEVGLNEEGVLDITDDVLYPNTKIYDGYRFGKNLDLLLTDYRTYRPDHLVPEDAFPGEIVMNRGVLETVLGPDAYAAIAPGLDPYVNLDGHPVQPAATFVLTQLYLLENPLLTLPQAAARAAGAASGDTSALYLNELFAALGQPRPFPDVVLAQLDRGLSYAFVGKRALYSSTGSRYIIAKDTYELLAGYLAFTTNGATQDAFGPEQRAWLAQSLFGSDATWRVIGSSVSATPMVLDFTNPQIAQLLPPGFPDEFRTRLSLNVDQWDGFPDFRERWLEQLGMIPNTVLVSGDIHATFVTDHKTGVFEFTGPAISSATFGSLVDKRVADDPQLSQVPGIENLLAQLDPLLQLSAANPDVSRSDIVYNNTAAHGFMFFEATADRFLARYHLIPQTHVFESYYDDPDALDEIVQTITFEVRDGRLLPVTD